MNDKPTNSLISAYHDGELNPAERTEVERLLATSAEARAELESYRQMSTLLQAGRPTLDRDLTPMVMQTIRQQGSKTAQPVGNGRQREWTKWAALAAVAMGLIIAVGISLQPNPQGPQIVKVNPQPPEGPVKPPVTPVVVKPVDVTPRPQNNNTVTVARNDATDVKPVDVGLAPEDLPLEVIENLKKANPGKIVRFLKQSGQDQVAVFHLMVLDVQPGLESLQMILSAQQISGPMEKNGQVGVMAVYVQANQDQLDKVIAQLIHEEQKQFVALAVQPPVKVEEVQKVMKSQATEVASQQVPVQSTELSSLGVAPVKSEQLAGSRDRRRGSNSVPFAQKTPTGRVDQSPMRKVLIVLEKAPPEFLNSNQPN